MNKAMIRLVVRGMAVRVPGLMRWRARAADTASARYCYSVWLRHLVTALENGMSSIPESIVELGPGGSLGTGLAALLSGSRAYWGLDAVALAQPATNLAVFDELVELFRRKEPIPGEAEFPRVAPKLDSYAFPSHAITNDALTAALAEDRIQAIRRMIAQNGSKESDGVSLCYVAPWSDSAVVRPDAVEFVFSQGALECVCVSDLEGVYGCMGRWVKPGGHSSHQTNFGWLSTGAEWNRYWGYSDFYWKLIAGDRGGLCNRAPLSAHLSLHRSNGFEVVHVKRHIDESGIGRDRLAPRFRNLTDEDLVTRSAYVLARKNQTPPTQKAPR